MDTLLIARAKKGSKHTPEEHMILSCALKHEKAQACASKPAPFVIPPGIMKELTSMMQTWLMNEAACPPAVRQEPDNTHPQLALFKLVSSLQRIREIALAHLSLGLVSAPAAQSLLTVALYLSNEFRAKHFWALRQSMLKLF